jgi:transcriptional regulator with GAF, ATPase, and Fis domain
MVQPQELLLGVWREAGRHTDMATSTANVAQLLARWMPIAQVLVRRIEPERSCVETVGIGTERSVPRSLGERSDCSPTHLRRLLAWCHRGEATLRRRGGGNVRELEAAVPPELDEELLVGPLVSEHGTCGVILLLAAPVQRFTPPHQRMLQAILEPLAAALENDRRLRELTALREAAEADKQSLLRRLGRTEVAETIVGADGRLRPVMERVALVSPSDVPVLILGETGSGKEVIARAIHTRSARAAGPFIRVNCGAIPTDLIDSELFGHEKGSFTGAVGTRKGWFERADEGTLFLDEIGELPPAAQVRLLRVLQEGIFERVGGERSIKVDVRIVAATNRRLQHEAAQGRFRTDLRFRLDVLRIAVPPLRDRITDIPILAQHFWRQACIRVGTSATLGPDALAALSRYDWPGNVRELENIVERLVVISKHETVQLRELPLDLQPSHTPLIEQLDDQDYDLRKAVHQFEREYIRRVLEKTHWNQTAAARMLGIHRNTLLGKIEQLDLR